MNWFYAMWLPWIPIVLGALWAGVTGKDSVTLPDEPFDG